MKELSERSEFSFMGIVFSKIQKALEILKAAKPHTNLPPDGACFAVRLRGHTIEGP